MERRGRGWEEEGERGVLIGGKTVRRNNIVI
jgi:hypothetical protein